MEKVSKKWNKPISHTSELCLGRQLLAMPYWESGSGPGFGKLVC